jgi:hypothetical protein
MFQGPASLNAPKAVSGAVVIRGSVVTESVVIESVAAGSIGSIATARAYGWSRRVQD